MPSNPDATKPAVDLSAVKPELLEQLLKEEGAIFNLFPLSYAQERLWFLDQLTPDSCLYNMPLAVRIKGRLDPSALESGFKRVIERHETLRTTFVSINGRPMQAISPTVDWNLSLVDLSALPGEQREREARRLARTEAQRPIDLRRGPLIRATLLRLGEEDQVLLVTMHHIVSDGWSVSVLFRELQAHLHPASESESSRLEKLPIQYADYAMWQRESLQGKALEEQLAYWKKQLGGDLCAPKLPTDKLPPTVRSFHGARQGLTISAALSQELKALSRREGVTLFVALLAAFKVLLFCYTRQEEIIVATSVANRHRPELENLIGLFINILALRTDLSGDPSFIEILRRVRDVALGAYAHQDLPFERLVAELQPARVTNQAPLTQIAFTLRNAPADLQFSGLTLSSFEASDTATAKTDLMMYLVERPEGITGTIEYNTDLFEAATIQEMIGSFQILIEAAVAEPQKRLSRLSPLIGKKAPGAAAAPPRLKPTAASLVGAPLTRSQMLYWTGQQSRPDAPLFNMINAFRVSGEIDAGHFQLAFQTLINSSDALRTVIVESGGTPAQRVLPGLIYNVEMIDLSRSSDPDEALAQWMGERRRVVFNMEERLFEAALIKLSHKTFVWYLNHHQLVGDAWTTLLIYKRLSQFYGLSRKGRLEEVVTLPQFRDYTKSELEYRKSPRFQKIEAYWKEKSAQPTEPLTIYGKAPKHPTRHGNRMSCPLGRKRMEKLQELAARDGIFVATSDLSLFNLFASWLLVYLYRISGAHRLALRVMHHNRLTKNYEETLGMFIEVLPLRITIDEGETFLSVIRKVAAETLETFKNGRHTIVGSTQDKTFDVALNYINAPFPTFDGSPATAAWVHPGVQNEILNLHVRKLGSSGELTLEFDFDCDVFSEHEQKRAVRHFLRMLDLSLEDVNCSVDRPDLLSLEKQRQRIRSLEEEATFDFA